VNRSRDQLLARPRFALDQNGGIGGRDAFDFSEHRFQDATLAYDLFESALISLPVYGP
jgi:hypothetical protein